MITIIVIIITIMENNEDSKNNNSNSSNNDFSIDRSYDWSYFVFTQVFLKLAFYNYE